MQGLRVYAPAKLNLYLDVLDKRPDGYHNIKTLFEKIDLKDEIEIIKKPKGINVRVEPKSLCPEGKDNIVYKAVESLLKESKADLGFDVIIKKNIPTGSGLGGGSSDVASVLRAINENFDLGILPKRLFHIASLLGKDVPFFMLDTSFAMAQLTGEDLETIETDTSFFHIVVKPDVSISTKSMYKRLDKLHREPRRNGLEAIIPAIKNKDLKLLKKTYYNVFEEVLSDNAQYIEEMKSLLLTSGVDRVFLSGSGSALFSTFKEKADAMKVLERLPKKQGMDVFLATTYKGGIYGDNRGKDIS